MVGSIAKIAGGRAADANILGANALNITSLLTTGKSLPLNIRVANAEVDRKNIVDFVEKARIEKGFPLITPMGVDWISSK